MTRSGILDSAGSSEDWRLAPPAEALGEKCEIHDFNSVRWAWAGRHLTGEAPRAEYRLLLDYTKPRPADVAVVRVERVGYHHHLETENERRLRLYEGDRLIGVFGNRYATDVYEGRVLELKKLHLLTASGLIGTVVSRHHDVGRPTAVSFVGYLADSSGSRINLKQLRFQPAAGLHPSANVILVVGSGMNTGKTTVTRKILRALAARGVRVAGCKLTGSASPRDLYEMRATGAVHATDFSDYGFPSTYGESLGELIRLLDVMTDACERAGAELVVAEIADGFLQPETQMLLECEEMRHRVRGVVVAGACSSSLLFATEFVQKAGLDVWAASGLATNSPLFAREFSARSSVPVASSRGGAARLARIVMDKLAAETPEDRRWKAAARAE
jgi:hypothetical protein